MRKRVTVVLLAICLCTAFFPPIVAVAQAFEETDGYPLKRVPITATALRSSVNYEEAYAEILDLYQRCVKTIVVNGGFADENPWSLLLELTPPSWNSGLTGEDFGFAFRDLNQNGTPELILLTQKIPYIIAVYSLPDGNPQLLMDCAVRNTCHIREDGILVNKGSSGASDNTTKFYSISQDDASLVLIDQMGGLVDSFAEMELAFTSVSTLWDGAVEGSQKTDSELLKLASDLWDTQYNMIWTFPPAAWFQTEWSPNPFEYGGKRWFAVTSSQVSSLTDIQAYWENYFTEDFAPPEWYLQNYAEIDGRLYSANGGIGGDITLVDFEFDHIISRDNTTVRIFVLEKRDDYLDTPQQGNIVTKEFIYTMVREGDRWKCDDVTYTDGTPFLSRFGVRDSEGTVAPFTDVKSDAYYAGPVKWAVEKGIAFGTSATTFSPAQNCTAAQILTFLWRANGSPEPMAAAPSNGAADYYYKAVLWAAEKGMVSASAFRANTPCTRAAAVKYMWQAAGSPAAAYDGRFHDVPAGADYAQAVAWALENGVTVGTSPAAFSPDSVCTRGQIVTFLYRAMGN